MSERRVSERSLAASIRSYANSIGLVLNTQPGEEEMSLTKEQRVERARNASVVSWSRTEDRAARTAAARKTFEESFESEAARKDHYRRMALKSAEVRRAKAQNP